MAFLTTTHFTYSAAPGAFIATSSFTAARTVRRKRLLSRLRITIVPSPSSNDHEVQLFADDQEVIAGLDGLGLDPDDFFAANAAIVAGKPRDARVGRCDCGVVGCGDLSIRIERDGEEIVWGVAGTELRFDAAQYDAELARAAADHSWESRERTAERLVRERVDRRALTKAGLVFEWASGRARPRLFTIALHTTSAPDRQIFVEVPWSGDVEQVVAAALAALTQRGR